MTYAETVPSWFLLNLKSGVSHVKNTIEDRNGQLFLCLCSVVNNVNFRFLYALYPALQLPSCC